MKNTNFAAIFILIFWGSTLLQAQQPSHNNQAILSNEVKRLNAIIPDFQVNENVGPFYASQRVPSITIDGCGNFVITWYDRRNGDSDIYAQRYSSDGNLVEKNFKVNDDQVNEYQNSPSIAIDDSGKFVIVWSDRRNGDYDIYAQRYSSDGRTLGINFKVSDDQENANQRYPIISIDDSSNFMIIWEDQRNGDYDIYAQHCSSNGIALNTNFKINDDQGNANQQSPSISRGDSGNFVITWQDERNGNLDIYAQRYSSNGNILGTNFKANDDQGSADQLSPAVSSDTNGNFIITWEDRRNVYSDTYAQRYLKDGAELGPNFMVNDKQGTTGRGYLPSISMEGSGNFVVAWIDYRHGDLDIYAQRYSSDGFAVGSNFKVTNTLDGKQFDPEVKLWNNRIYFTWSDTRVDSTGYDIWANVLDWENPVGIPNNLSPIPTEFILRQNYPNPFNSSTTISYSKPEPGNVILKIYNLLGNEIHKFENKFQDAGTYSINFNASDLPSGIYFYRIRIGEFWETKKFILQR